MNTDITNMFETFYGDSTDAVLLHNSSGLILDVNDSFLRLFKRERKDIEDRNITEIFPENIRNTFFEGMVLVRRNGSARYDLRYNDNQVNLYIDISFLRLKHSDNLVITTIRDITNIRALKDNQVANGLFLNSLLNTITHPIFVKNEQLRYTNANLAFLQVFTGTDDFKLIRNKTVLDLDTIPRETAEIFYKADQQVWAKKMPQTYEGPITCADGRDRHFIFNKSIYFSPGGKPAGIIGIMTDITARKQFEQSSEKNRLWLRAILDNTDIAIFIIDSMSLDIIDVNAAGLLLIDRREHEVLLQSAQMLLFASGKPPFERSHLADERNREAMIILPSGNQIPVLRTIVETKILDKTYLIASFIDIRDRKMLERQLLQAQKLESIGQLAAGIAHEINTPIQYIGDNLNFIGDGFSAITELVSKYKEMESEVPADSSQLGSVNSIRTGKDVDYLISEIPLAISQSQFGVEQVATIVRAMKEFSRPGVTARVPININDSIEDTIAVSKNEWKYVADMQLDLSPDLPLVTIYPSEFNQVILNIITNAAQALEEKLGEKPAHKGFIRISTAVDGDFICLTIQDSGPGISEKNLGRIFDPFFSTKDVGKGTGQGLAIVHDFIVKKMNGRIEAGNHPDGGAVFTIHIPLDSPNEADDLLLTQI